MSWCVYIHYSGKDGNLYVGCTSNVSKRMSRHHNGNVQATKSHRPLALIHTEEFESKADAFQRERFLKSLWGGREKKKIKQWYLNTQQED